MAHLLGSKYCLESLESDVTDLQSAVIDVSSRVGPVRYPSWKFPDKISSDLDIPSLLEEHTFSDDNEDNQVSHIVLFELVIDRMMLLLQSFSRFVELLLSGTQGRPPTAGHIVGSQMSIGLVVKKFWNKMVQLHNLCQQLNTENKSKSKTVQKLEAINAELQLQTLETSKKLNLSDTLNAANRTATRTSPLKEALSPELGVLLPPKSNQVVIPYSGGEAQSGIAKDTRTVASQTLETSFVPCEACACVQLSLKSVTDMIVEVCESQGLPSAMARHRSQEVVATMTASDVSRWTKEQGKDLDRIRKHLQDLLAQIDPLKLNFSASETECSQLKQGINEKSQELKREKAQRETQLKQHQSRLKEVERQHAESVLVVHRSLEETTKGKRRADEEISALKRELQKQCETLQALEDIKSRLTLEAEGNTSNMATIARLESRVQQLSNQLQSTSEELQETSKQLGKEQARNRSIDKHGQSMQGKHDALARRVDDLDQACCNLRDELAESEDAQEQLMEQLKEAQGEVKQLKEQLQQEKDLASSIREEREFLESSILDLQTMIVTLEGQLEDAQSRERMLVQYPDMNPGIVPQGPMPTGEGDNPSDMRQQVQSNNIRIQILEEQNNQLRKNITKMLDGQGHKHQGAKVSGPAIPLWQSSGSLARDLPNNSSSKAPTAPQPRDHQPNIYTHKVPYPEVDDSCSQSKSIHSPDKVATTNYNSRTSPSKGDPYSSAIPPRPAQREVKDRSKVVGGKRTTSNTGVNLSKSGAALGSSSLSAYMKLKQSGAINVHGESRNKSSNIQGKVSSNGKPPPKAKQGWIHSAYNESSHRSTKEQYSPLNTFVCQSCDKMYTSEQDLEIHQSYCYG
ncbi:coiled-coil domain-containing protein 157-like [Asterias rubens]|uniref:coiled-coil domain-containing protein 157-like n=1 Tax=Asterias rubens TaxID=7604 RepID=UPI001454FDCD|nr:coiled-coil domain-containing protein 157-like [Asterias rubens]